MMNKAETLKSGVVSSTGSVDWRSKLPHSNLNPGLFWVVVPPGKDNENINTHDTV